MSPIHPSLKYGAQFVKDFSKNRFTFYPTQTANVQSGQQITFVLPSGTVNLDSLKLYGSVRVDATNIIPPNIESLFTNIQLQINGTAVVPGTQAQNLLTNIKLNWLAYDQKTRRSVAQLNAPLATATSLPTGTTAPVAGTIPAVAAAPTFCLTNFGDVLESIQPRVISTQVIGEVRVMLTVAQPWINNLVMNNNSGVYLFPIAGFQSVFLDNLKCTVEMWSLGDSGYMNDLNTEMSRAPLELPFTYYNYFSGSAIEGSPNQTLKMPVNTKSLSHVIGGFLNGATYQAGLFDSTTGSTSAFTTVGTDVSTSVFTLNSVQYPSMPATPLEIFENNLDVLGLTRDVVGTHIRPEINSLDNFKNKFFNHMVSFDQPSKPSDRWVSGTDTSGNQVQLAWSTVGTGANSLTKPTTSGVTYTSLTGSVGSYLPYCFVGMQGVLEVGANRNIRVIW